MTTVPDGFGGERRSRAFTSVSPYPLNLFQVREAFCSFVVVKTTMVSSDVDRESHYRTFISSLPYILNLFRVRAEYSLWLCNFLLPIVTSRLFPASSRTRSPFAPRAPQSLSRYSYVVALARATTPYSLTIRSIARLYRQVRSYTFDASAYEKSDFLRRE